MRIVRFLSWGVLVTFGGPGLASLSAQTPDNQDPPRLWEESEQLIKALHRRIDFPGIDDPKAELLDVLNRLAKQYDLPLELNKRAFNSEKVDDVAKTNITESSPIPLMKGTTLSTVLRRILARIPVESGARYVVRRDTIGITTGAAWYRELDIRGDTRSPPVKKQYQKIELREAFEELGERVLIDIRVEKQARTKISGRFYYVPAETVIELLTDMAGLAVVRLDGVYYVTSPDNAVRMKKELAGRQPKEAEEEKWLHPGFRALESARPGITLCRAMESLCQEVRRMGWLGFFPGSHLTSSGKESWLYAFGETS